MISSDNISYMIDTLVKLDINIEQFLFCIILKDRREHELYRYTDKIKHFSEEDIQDLIEKGYIYCYNDHNATFDQYTLTDKFSELVYTLDIDQPGEELWDSYPTFITVGSNTKTIARNYNKNEFVREYYKKYGRFKVIHDEIIKLTIYGRKKGLINCGIQKYLAEERWIAIKEDYEANKNASLPSNRVV